MTRQKDQKRIIRNRMKKTGESYTAARAQVIGKASPRQTTTATVIDHAAIAGMSNEKVAAKTGRTWPEWVRVLDADGAAAMPHREIATLLHTKHQVADWWAQTVTVGYERIKGLRERGQRRGGAYEVSKSRTFDVPVDRLFRASTEDRARRRWIGVESKVRTATPSKSARLQWPDGSIIALWFTAKGPKKSALALAHTKLPDKTAAERAKKEWGDRLDALGSMLGTGATS